jgi:hypothetical protein
MRRLLSITVVAVTTMLVPMFAIAGNQELADQVAKNLRNSGKLSDYHVGVKCQNGTVWLRGQVTDEQQMNAVLKTVYKIKGVTRVVNDLEIDGSETEFEAMATPNQQLSFAQKVPTSHKQSSIRQATAMEPDVLPQQHSGYMPARPINGKAPIPVAMTQTMQSQHEGMQGEPRPMYNAAAQGGVAPVRYDQPCMPNYAWPSYAAYPNYAAVTYPRQYSPTAWPYIGPFYPYPQVPLGWRKVTLQWKDGWWFLDFRDSPAGCYCR